MHLHSEGIFEFSGWLPFVRVFGVLIPTYYLVISLVFCLCLVLLVRRTERLGLDRTIALDASLAIMIGGFFGARLFHVLVEAPQIYIEHPMQLMRVWEGGFVWYGGALTGAALAILIVRRRGEALGPWFDLFAPLGAAGYAGGRIACLLTGCCFGSICVLKGGWAFRYPTQLFAVLWELGAAGLLLYLETKRGPLRAVKTQIHRKKARVEQPFGFIAQPGGLFTLWILLHAIGRMIMEVFRADERGPTLLSLSVSTWISLALLFGAIGFARSLQRQAPTKTTI